jgi:hypothetical protein
MQRDATKDTDCLNASVATRCYQACLHLLEPGDNEVSHLQTDKDNLRSKCLIQLSLALHLSQEHNEALDTLNKVVSQDLLRDTQELRLGILLAVSKHIIKKFELKIKYKMLNFFFCVFFFADKEVR